MAKILVETLSEVPTRTSREISLIRGDKRGVRPSIRGPFIVAGRLTIKRVCEALDKNDIPFTAILFDRQGHKPYRLRGSYKDSERSLPAIVKEQTITTPELFFGSRILLQKIQEEKAEKRYFKLLGMTAPERSTALHCTLCHVIDVANSFCPVTGYLSDLRPWHLVDLTVIRTDGQPICKVSLKKIDRLSSGLSGAIWSMVHISERGGDLIEAARRLDDQLLDFVQKPDNIESLYSFTFIPR